MCSREGEFAGAIESARKRRWDGLICRVCRGGLGISRRCSKFAAHAVVLWRGLGDGDEECADLRGAGVVSPQCLVSGIAVAWGWVSVLTGDTENYVHGKGTRNLGPVGWEC